MSERRALPPSSDASQLFQPLVTFAFGAEYSKSSLLAAREFASGSFVVVWFEQNLETNCSQDAAEHRVSWPLSQSGAEAAASATFGRPNRVTGEFGSTVLGHIRTVVGGNIGEHLGTLMLFS